jgi:hypothetical protein
MIFFFFFLLLILFRGLKLLHLPNLSLRLNSARTSRFTRSFRKMLRYTFSISGRQKAFARTNEVKRV